MTVKLAYLAGFVAGWRRARRGVGLMAFGAGTVVGVFFGIGTGIGLGIGLRHRKHTRSADTRHMSGWSVG